MKGQTVQTSQEIQAQLTQVQNELRDIDRALPMVINTTDLLGAQAERRDREAVVLLLQQRLQEARERERVQGEKDKRAELERQRDDARAEFDRLTALNEELLAPMFEMFNAGWPDLAENIRARWAAAARFSDAVFLLNNRQEVYGANGRLEDQHDDHSELRGAILAVYRRHLQEQARAQTPQDR